MCFRVIITFTETTCNIYVVYAYSYIAFENIRVVSTTCFTMQFMRNARTAREWNVMSTGYARREWVKGSVTLRAPRGRVLTVAQRAAPRTR